MEIETANAMNDGMYLSLMTIKVVMLIFILLTIAAFVIYLAGIAWACFEEKQRAQPSRSSILDRHRAIDSIFESAG